MALIFAFAHKTG